jgi:predicted lipid-binding transport protein (Tim44 family)
MDDTDAFLIFVLVLLILVGFGFMYFRNKPTSAPSGRAGAAASAAHRMPQPKRPGQPADPNKTMYIPKEIGTRTGQKKVFQTNRGLRLYETNEHGFPMPAPKSE